MYQNSTNDKSKNKGYNPETKQHLKQKSESEKSGLKQERSMAAWKNWLTLESGHAQ